MVSAPDKARPWLDREHPEYFLPLGLRRAGFPAMGTSVSMLLPHRSAETLAEMVRSLFWEWEQTLSRFLPGSELSSLNRRAGITITVSPLLGEVLATALDAAVATDGLYDPTLLPQLAQLGYDRPFDAMPDVVPTLAFPPSRGGRWRQIHLDRERLRVTMPVGTALDFGGIAKGMAVDAAMQRLRGAGVDAALVNAGGDLAVLGVPPGGTDWTVVVSGHNGRIWKVPLRHGAMATSGIARRRWHQGRVRRHHLLDPRTGLPAQCGLWSASVVATQCVQAEVAAKAAFILGREDGARFLRERCLAGLLIDEGGRWRPVGAWPLE